MSVQTFHWSYMALNYFPCRLTDSGVFTDFTMTYRDASNFYVNNGGVLYAQPMEYGSPKGEPYCIGCNTPLSFEPTRLTEVTTEGVFKSITEVPYCPECEEKPKGHVVRWG